MLENAKWIWQKTEGDKDTYVEFYSPLSYTGGNAEIEISCDGDYTLFINGKYVSSSQYGDYEHYKIYDKLNITSMLKTGENHLGIIVWHFGESSSRYKPYKAGLIFNIAIDGKSVLSSSESIPSRQSLAYENGRKKRISSQLGYSFAYNINNEDGWLLGEGKNMKKSCEVSKNCTLYPRPIPKHTILPLVEGKELLNENNTHYIFDLGREEVGFLSFTLNAEKETDILISFGEHLEDTGVRRIIGDRDFSIEYKTKSGANEFTNYMLRLGCRYLEIQTRHPVFFDKIGILPQSYPVNKHVIKLENQLDIQIYDICIHTLECCMMEHYVDCPWREQCLYAFDSRNQMKCGYYAFDGGNFEYARSNLLLMSKDERKDGLLSICFPCGIDLTIPSFSLYYILSAKEYLEHSGDLTLIDEINPKLQKILDTYVKNTVNGLIYSFEGANHWNFYDWAPYCEGSLYNSQRSMPDLIINLLGIIALSSYEKICSLCALDFNYADYLSELKLSVRKEFLNRETGLFFLSKENKVYTELGCALAILANVCDDREAENICNALVDNTLSPCSLSMKTFKYDALLIVNKDRYAPWIINEIRQDYKKMLDAGSTTVWETMDGADDFDKAGSLCHGWSAIPVYYYNILSDYT